MKMKSILFGVFAVIVNVAIAQEGDVFLIKPIVEGPEISADQVKGLARFQAYRNWGISKIGLDSVKLRLSGKGASVCVCDTGNPSHQDLVGVVLESANFTTDQRTTDGNGHATHVIGIIHEIAPDAEIYAAKVLTDKGSGSSSGVAQGIDWCAARKVTAISMSLGSPSPSSAMESAIKRATDAGILVVVAAGNSGAGSVDNIDYPGRYPETITVGSVNSLLGVSAYSSSGPEGDIMAPGEKILSNWLNNDFILLSGTSMATPFISGMAALYQEQEGNTYTFRSKLQQKAFDLLDPGFDRLSFWGLATTATFDIGSTPPDDPVPPAEGKTNWLAIGALAIAVVLLGLLIWNKYAKK